MERIFYFCVVFALTGFAFTSECPISCSCGEGFLQCTGLQEFVNHTEIPENVTLVVYDSCSFKEMASPLMYRNIVELRIRNSGLENIAEGIFAEMNALKTLDMQNNYLRTLSPLVFSGLTSLQYLFLSHNQLPTLPDRFFLTMPSLIHVELDENRHFFFTSSMFAGASSNLTKISFNRCDITNLTSATEALGSVIQLKELSLSGNHLSHLEPFEFSNIPQLEILYLDNCLIESVNNGSFTGLKQIWKLDLSHNSLKALPSDTFAESKSSLKAVFLNDNLFDSLDEDLLQWSSVQQLSLHNNPWNCSCSLSWIQTYKFGVNSTNATCSEPESSVGVSIFSFPFNCAEQSPSEDKSSSIVVLAIVIPIIIICLVVIGCFLFKVIQTMIGRKRHAQEKGSFRYSAVYKETVEPAAGVKQKTVTGQSYQLKQNPQV